MIKSLELENFTVFEHAIFELSEGINIVIGENGTGKSHFLKAAYATVTSLYCPLQPNEIEPFIQVKLSDTFKMPSLDAYVLCRNNKDFTMTIIVEHLGEIDKVYINYHGGGMGFSGRKGREERLSLNLLFIPSKEVLSIYPNFVSLYEKYHLSFDETYYDLCKALDNPLLKKLDEPAQALLHDLEMIIGGQVIVQGGHFYIKQLDSEQLMDIGMVAEGHRKIAMLAYLIANDSIVKGCTLFWDEPETNLNPRLMRQLAKALAALAKYGVQVILATHSYFLMKEISLLNQQDSEIPARFFSLIKTEEQGVKVEQADNLTDLQTIVSLDEELDQYDRDQALYYKKAS
ncbi:AAA family ATPase [Candidatus Albibeggiatoa sp. nov. BB20]|uniref:AAA family ATPase n=1 Tax=Candidatus Albibeggiatoa sp. nov. BB20 TaxID=3162723 RepID=UPI003365520E